MAKKGDDKKIGGIKSTDQTKAIRGTQSVSEVEGVKGASAIGAIKGGQAIGKRRPTRTMSLAEREHLFSMINEEADKMFATGALSKQHKQVVQKAVKMAIDTTLGEEESADNDPQKKG